MTPSIQASNLNISLINSSGFRLKYTKGNGDRRIVAVTEGGTASIKYPINGITYKGNLKFGQGDSLTAIDEPIGSTTSCVGLTATPIQATMSKTYVVYEGLGNGNIGLDIIHLNPSKEYQVMVFEETDKCYATSSIISLNTGFEPNKSEITLTVYDNKTKKQISNADIAIKNSRSFISEFGKTNSDGEYVTEDLEEGRYEISVLAGNYEPKILSGIFIQRLEPMRDNNFRIFTTTGRTEFGQSVERKRLRNKNNYVIYLDPLNTIGRSFTKYVATDNPSHLTKL